MSEEPPRKRFRYQTYNQQLAQIKVDTGRSKGLRWNPEEEEDLSDDEAQARTPLTTALTDLSLLHLCIPYVEITRQIIPFTRTLPLTLHNLGTIQECFHGFFQKIGGSATTESSGLDGVLVLYEKLYETVLDEALGSLEAATMDLLRIGAIKGLQPVLVEKSYTCLSSLFKLLAPALLATLVRSSAGSITTPPDRSSILPALWSTISPELSSERSHVRTCAAGLWSILLRRGRGEVASRLIEVMLVEAEDNEATARRNEEGVTLALGESMRGAPHLLHSRAGHLYSVLLQHLLTSSVHNARLLRIMILLTTSLIHHCSASNLVPLQETVLGLLQGRRGPMFASEGSAGLTSTVNGTHMALVMRIAAVFVGVRKGQRLASGTQLGQVGGVSVLQRYMSALATLVPQLATETTSTNPEWRRNYIRLLVACLIAGKLTDWLSPGVKLIDMTWESLSQEERFGLVEVLGRLKWLGLEQFVLGHAAKLSLQTLPSHTLLASKMLYSLAENGFLDGGLVNVQGGKWKESLGKAIANILAGWTANLKGMEAEERSAAVYLMRVIPKINTAEKAFFPALEAFVTGLRGACLAVSANQARSDFAENAWTPGYLLGEALLCIGELSSTSDRARKLAVELGQGASELMASWAWHRGFLHGLAQNAHVWASGRSLESVAQDLVPLMISEDPLLKSDALRILAAAVQPKLERRETAPGQEAINLFRACLDVEEAGMSLQNVRERTTRIRKVGLLVRSIRLDYGQAWILRAIVAFLCGQLKVNFRPLYPDTIEVLSEMGQEAPDAVWDGIIAEILKCEGDAPEVLRNLKQPVWAGNPTAEGDMDAAPEEEKSMHCPNAAKLDKAVEMTFQNGCKTLTIMEALQAQVSDARLDAVNYEAQLIGVLKAIPALAERHSRSLVPLLLDLADRELKPSDLADPAVKRISQRTYQARLGTHLELFAKMSNPKALYRTDEVYECFLKLLSIGENKLQGQALACVLTYKDPAIVPYEERLNDLLIDSKFRDTLAKLSLGTDSETIDPMHREKLLPIIIRILFGIMSARRGRNSSNQGSAARKHAILASLGQCAPEELETLVNLMLKPFGLTHVDEAEVLDLKSVSGKRQTGYLTLLGDVIKHLAPQTMIYWPKLLRVCISITANAQNLLGLSEAEEDIGIAEDEIEERSGSIPARTIRQLGLRRISAFFGVKLPYDFRPYVPAIFDGVISPRIPSFASENTQAPSALMEVFLAWSRPEYLRYYVDFDERVLPAVFSCLGQPKTKDTVIKRIFDLLETFLRYMADETPEDMFVSDRLLRPYMGTVLSSMATLMGSTLKGAESGRDELVKRAIIILGRLSPLAGSSPQARELIDMLTPLLKRPGKKVSERVKTDILLALLHLYGLVAEAQDPGNTFFRQNINLLATLFRSLRTRQARTALTAVYAEVSTRDVGLARIQGDIEDLNAFSAKRVDEPDFERRLRVFARLNDDSSEFPTYTEQQWVPLLYNLLFFVQDPEELSIRTNASQALKRFLTMAGKTQAEGIDQLVLNVVYPALRHMFDSRFELVRAESLNVLAHAVRTCGHLGVLAEMVPLLAAGDQEASVFFNLYHLQIHRRTRALQRLAETAPHGTIREVTWANLFLPIIGHFVTDEVDRVDHALINAAVSAIGKIAGTLTWPRYQSLVLAYLRMGKLASRNQKHLIRTVTSILDNFHFQMEHVVPAQTRQPDEEGSLDADEAEGAVSSRTEADSSDITSQRVEDYVVNKLLPALNDFIAQKDEAEFTIRIPVALGVVQVAMALPEQHKEAEIARTVLTLSQVLRSKDQDTRDLVKSTMSRIAVRLGSRWLSTVLKEMRAALQRGPQLQVLAVVVHAILVHATTEAPDQFSNLDNAVDDVAHVSAEVIWGQSGTDVMTDGFRTKMREVRSAMSRGYDNYQMAARLVSPARISHLLLPIKSIMQETHAIKQMQQVDECLRRIASGLNANKHVDPADMLRLCHTLINANSDFFLASKPEVGGQGTVRASHKVQMKRNLAIDQDHFEANSHKFIAFGLDLFVTAFRRGRFDFGDPVLLARMNPLVVSIGNTLYSKHSSVVMLGLRASAAIIQCPLPSIEDALPTFIQQIIGIIKRNGGSADSEVSLTALKCLAVIIRDCKAAQLKEKQVTFLLDIIKPDLEEHEKQATLFAVLRAIVSRKLVVPEIYDLMEKVSSIMVTSQSSHVQELCRSVLIQFLLDYPQGKGRLRSQMSFLAQNLSYVYESGRLSVMELLSAIFRKFSEDLVNDYSDLFFVALVMVLSNDDAEKCRKMAGALVSQLLVHYDELRLAKLVVMLTSWSSKTGDEIALSRSAAVVTGILAQAAPALQPRHVETLVRNLGGILRTSAQALADEEELPVPSAFESDHPLDYATAFQALTSLRQCQRIPGVVIPISTLRDVITLLLFPHDWVRIAAATVLEAQLAIGAEAIKDAEPSMLGHAALLEIARKSCLVLGRPQSSGRDREVPSSALCDQLVKLIFAVAKCWIVDFSGPSSFDDPVDNAEDLDPDPDDGNQANQASQSPLTWLMSRLSFVARTLIIHRPSAAELISRPIGWAAPLAAVFHTFAALVDGLPVPSVERYLRHVLNPVYRISGDVTDFNQEADEQNETIFNLAVEMRELIQAKVGLNKFSVVWEDLRKKASEKRGERRRNKEEMAVANPEGFAQRKEQRGAMKKDAKKRKQRSFADAKQRERPVKARKTA